MALSIDDLIRWVLAAITSDKAAIVVGFFLVSAVLLAWWKLPSDKRDYVPRPLALGMQVVGIGLIVYGIVVPPSPWEPQRIGGHITSVPPGVILRTRGNLEQNQLWASYWWESAENFSIQWMLLRPDAETEAGRRTLNLQLTHHSKRGRNIYVGDTAAYTEKLSDEQRSRLRSRQAEFDLVDMTADDRDPHFLLLDKLANWDRQANRREPDVVAKFVRDGLIRDERRVSGDGGVESSLIGRAELDSLGRIGRAAIGPIFAPAHAGTPPTERRSIANSVASAADTTDQNVASLPAELSADNADVRGRAALRIKKLVEAQDPAMIRWLNDILAGRATHENPEDLLVSLLYVIRAIVNEGRSRDELVRLHDNLQPIVAAIEPATLEALVREALVLEHDGSPVGNDVRRFLRAVRDDRIPAVFDSLATAVAAPYRACVSAVEQNIYYNWQISLLEQIKARARPISRSDMERLFLPLSPLLERAAQRITTPSYRVQSAIGLFGTGYVFATLLSLGDDVFAAAERDQLRDLSIDRSRSAFRQFKQIADAADFRRSYRFPWHAEIASNVLDALEAARPVSRAALDLPSQSYRTTRRDFSCRTPV